MKKLAPDEIKKMRTVGRLAAECLVHTGSFVKPGITTDELDQIAFDFTTAKGAKPAPLGYHGYPKSICTSVNNCICHGLPNSLKLKEGDIVNIDVTCLLDGFHGDTSAMFFVGAVSAAAKDLCLTAYEAMWKGIEEIKPGATTGDIGFAINKFTTRRGYYPVAEIGGHGIGAIFHGDPFVASVGKKGKGTPLVPWTCLTVEPMINQTSVPIVELDIPNSSIKIYETGDGSLSAQYEHTVLITDQGFEVLTQLD